LITVEIEETAHGEKATYENAAVTKEDIVPCGVTQMVAEDTKGKQITQESEAVISHGMQSSIL
jgi:hypothetical protein